MVPEVKKSLRSISIIIPSWDGKDLLEKYLPSVIRAANFYKGETEIIVVDDGSTDGSIQFLKANYPLIKLIFLKDNQGFAKACNVGVRESTGDIVIFLNNDMEVKEDFLIYLEKHFKYGKVFGVRPAIRAKQNELYNNPDILRMGLEFKFGFIETHIMKIDANLTELYPHTFSVSGGAAAVDRRKFLKMNGFDELFSPFYWEDVDLSYRAWKRGWTIIYEPKSTVYHQQHSTISKKYKQSYIKMISERNRYLLVWKNITNWLVLTKHILCIPARILQTLITGKSCHILSLIYALKFFNLLLLKRKEEKKWAKYSDIQLFNMFTYHVKE